ncbi:TIR domain-containing protein [Kribbella sp. NPDC050124]|uniref:TIR domain-containing protein n=1 Tax=Kribbella sp. NPDC050124 TaxID=3364114 RepID=UPI0037B188ED
MSHSAQQHLAELLDSLDALPYRDDGALDALRRRSEMIIRNVFGADSKYLTDLGRIGFHPQVYPADEQYVNSSWVEGVTEFRNLLQTMKEEDQLFGTQTDVEMAGVGSPATPGDPRVFLVHGHDDRIKVTAARFLEKLHLPVVILHERANAGRTIIEKFEEESASATFAVVLLTADDVGAARDAQPQQARARQNVVFELGYFIGVLGRSRVAALREPGVELPSDYAGVVYIELDSGDAWKFELAKEIKNSGIEVDLNRVLE